MAMNNLSYNPDMMNQFAQMLMRGGVRGRDPRTLGAPGAAPPPGMMDAVAGGGNFDEATGRPLYGPGSSGAPIGGARATGMDRGFPSAGQGGIASPNFRPTGADGGFSGGGPVDMPGDSAALPSTPTAAPPIPPSVMQAMHSIVGGGGPGGPAGGLGGMVAPGAAQSAVQGGMPGMGAQNAAQAGAQPGGGALPPGLLAALQQIMPQLMAQQQGQPSPALGQMQSALGGQGPTLAQLWQRGGTPR